MCNFHKILISFKREEKGRKRGREGEGRQGKGREGKGREGKEREGKGREGKFNLTIHLPE